MIIPVSWSQYLFFVLITLSIYYCIVCHLFYRKEIQTLVIKTVNPVKTRTQNNVLLQDQTGDALMTNIHELMFSINNVIKRVHNKNLIKEELVMLLKQTLKDYPGIMNSHYAEFINQHIRVTVSDKYSLDLDDHDLKNLWQ